MTEKELKEYWYAAYARALHMLQHPNQITEATVAVEVKRCGGGIFNRLFCLGVWQEIKLARAGKPSIPPGQYKDAVTDVWRIFRDYGDGDDFEPYWDRLVEEIRRVTSRYQYCPFIMNLAIHITLEAIEDIQRKKQATTPKYKKEEG